MIEVCLLSQSAPGKHNQVKSPQTFAHLVHFSNKRVCHVYNHKIVLFGLQNKQTFHMFSLLDLRFVLCSRDLDVLRAQRIMSFFYPQINEVGKSDHMGVIWRPLFLNHLVSLWLTPLPNTLKDIIYNIDWEGWQQNNHIFHVFSITYSVLALNVQHNWNTRQWWQGWRRRWG